MTARTMFPLALLLLLSPLRATLGQGAPGQQGEPRIRISTAEVALDVVVRDKKGRAVKDLSAADFEVYEDGVKQQVESFRLVLRESGTKEAGGDARRAANDAAARENFAGPSVIALVFDRLSPNARSLARKAALAYAEEGVRGEDFTGVFQIDLSLRTLQPYTENQQLVRQAVDRATSATSSAFASNLEQARSSSSRGTALERQGAAAAETAASAGAGRNSGGASAAGGEAGAAAVEQMFAQMNTRMLETFEILERDQQGYATINALLAVLNSMRHLPGRKTVIFFSEGLALPTAVYAKFNSVVNAANRANVSIYPVDAAGLRTESGTAEAARELNALASQSVRQAHSSRDSGGGPLMRSLERNEDLLRLNPQSGLNQLADQTGGFLISDTNDLGAGLRRIDEDMRAHYLLTYVPKRQEYDGRFRQVSVKLARPNLEAQTRKGYYAIDASATSPVLDYEAPALAALSRAGAANPLALQVAALNFPEAGRAGLTTVVAEVPVKAFTFATDAEKKTYGTDFSVVALVKDETGQVVEKLSQHYLLGGPAERLEGARRGEVLFYRETNLPPGRYTVEAVAYDAPTGKAGVRTARVEVPEADESKLRLSSVVLLKRAERLPPADQKKSNPFHFGEVLIYPNAGEPVRKSSKQLAFFFTAYPAQGAASPPQLTLEVQQGGKAVGRLSADLPAPDAGGRIQYASALPLDNFQPGAYELKVTVKDARQSVTRSASFTLEP